MLCNQSSVMKLNVVSSMVVLYTMWSTLQNRNLFIMVLTPGISAQ